MRRKKIAGPGWPVFEIMCLHKRFEAFYDVISVIFHLEESQLTITEISKCSECTPSIR